MIFAAGAASAAPVDPAAPLAPADEPTPSGGGRLIWDLADDLDLLGDLWAELPFRVHRLGELYLNVETRAAISRTAGDFEFEVRDFQYRVELGLRSRFSFSPDHRYALLVGQRGLERVDAPGQPYFRYVAWELARGDLRTPRDPRGARRDRWADWTVASGPVFDRREVDADFLVRGAARVWLSHSARLPALSLDVALDGQLDGDRLDRDLRVGPGVSFFLAGGPVATFSLHYQHSRNPLGIGHSAWLLGFDYASETGGRPRRPPQIEGTLAAGGGDDGRLGGQLRMRFVSPPFSGPYQAAILVEANLLTAEDTGDLFYRYDVGLERRFRASRAGIYFHHRSNHVLAEPNDQITSLNVAELGFESAGWLRAGRRTTARARGAVDGSARLGYLIDSDFGEQDRWHVRVALRYSAHTPAWPLQPYLRVGLAAGDVRGESLAAGLATARRWDLELEYRDDAQSFSRDPTVVMLSARYGF